MPQCTHEKIDDVFVAMRSENQEKALEYMVDKDDRLCGVGVWHSRRRDSRAKGRKAASASSGTTDCIAVITKLNNTEKDLRKN